MYTSKRINALTVMAALVLGLSMGSQAWANPEGRSCDLHSYNGHDHISCFNQNDCLSAGCPECVICADTFGNPVDGTNTEGKCIEDNSICQDIAGNDCTIAECNASGDDWRWESSRRGRVRDNLGCEFDNPPFDGVHFEKFEPICYDCMECGNGVCDSPVENCDNCAADCQEPDKACIRDQAALDAQCNQPGNDKNCDDGDIGTQDFCQSINVAGDQTCIVATRTCESHHRDFVCPMDSDDPFIAETQCVGPGGNSELNGYHDWTRRCSYDDPFCDPDCCDSPTQCGDGLVGGAETCDISVPGDDSGVPAILDTNCRPAGTQGECSACGDGVVQNQVEQCDVGDAATGRPADDSACPGQCNSLCLCDVEPIPGPPGTPGEPGAEGPQGPTGPQGPEGPSGTTTAGIVTPPDNGSTASGSGCSINSASNSGSFADAAMLLMMTGLTAMYVARRRKA